MLSYFIQIHPAIPELNHADRHDQPYMHSVCHPKNGQTIQLLNLSVGSKIVILTNVLCSSCRLKLISRALPDVLGVCLPEESTFLSVDAEKPGFLDLKADSYR
jgi:hypothetical protein